ncbi:hypothetical protein [Moraxella lacunata]|uniref:hypothetical protein n=1 Tax=Moraxella lacunata TaxID=477 RepID=UPI003EE0C75D
MGFGVIIYHLMMTIFLNNHAKIPHSFTQNHSSPNLNKRMMNDIWYCLVLFDENYFKT